MTGVLPGHHSCQKTMHPGNAWLKKLLALSWRVAICVNPRTHTYTMHMSIHLCPGNMGGHLISWPKHTNSYGSTSTASPRLRLRHWIKAFWALLWCIFEQTVNHSEWLDSKINITTWNNIISEPSKKEETIICFKSSQKHSLFAEETFGCLLTHGWLKNSPVVKQGDL